ncbi:MAG TPA: fructosamine kinase family protein [Gammaproteobacteria bacterium]|nr:fructosamine kinase family protein [Gammaproteobacteria bacterium]
MDFWQTVAAAITEASGEPFTIQKRRTVGGGCINDACVLAQGARCYFVKVNGGNDALEMFAAEQAGLEEISASATLRVPRPLCHGRACGRAYLVMEYLETGPGGRDSQVRLGRGLAAMHRHRSERYGWWRDNTIGATPQLNTPDRDWTRFWGERRLGFQLALAARKGFGGRLQRQGEKLLSILPAFLEDHRPVPSLLHGDLWSGNQAATAAGEPVIFDPAVYYGDREADLAMTELFGGFSPDFRAAYEEAWPLPPEYGVRKILYNLYHILNHLNLFGGGYLGQAEAMMDRLLAEAGLT